MPKSHGKNQTEMLQLLALFVQVKQPQYYIIVSELISFGPKQHLSALLQNKRTLQFQYVNSQIGPQL